jgi:hypothetical protein
MFNGSVDDDFTKLKNREFSSLITNTGELALSSYASPSWDSDSMHKLANNTYASYRTDPICVTPKKDWHQ